MPLYAILGVAVCEKNSDPAVKGRFNEKEWKCSTGRHKDVAIPVTMLTTAKAPRRIGSTPLRRLVGEEKREVHVVCSNECMLSSGMRGIEGEQCPLTNYIGIALHACSLHNRF